MLGANKLLHHDERELNVDTFFSAASLWGNLYLWVIRVDTFKWLELMVTVAFRLLYIYIDNILILTIPRIKRLIHIHSEFLPCFSQTTTFYYYLISHKIRSLCYDCSCELH